MTTCEGGFRNGVGAGVLGRFRFGVRVSGKSMTYKFWLK